MPVTVAHPAAVLPLRRLGLPTAALVIGSMVPDVPIFLRRPDDYRLSHSLTGILTVDLVASLVVLAGWTFVARDALVDLAPGPVRDRLPARQRLGPRAWLLAPVAAVLGSLTHVGWDAFTHADRWGVAQVAWLQAGHGPLVGYKWAQYLSGLVGTVVVLAVCLAHLRAQPVHPPRPRRVLPAPVLPVVLALAASYGLVAAVLRLDEGPHAVLYGGVVRGLLATVVAIALVSALWCGKVFLAVTSRNSPRTRRT